MQPPEAIRRARRSTAPLRIDAAEDDGSYVVAIHGEVDVATVEQVGAALDRAIASDAPEIVVDLGFCTFIDSRGIATLLGANRRLERCAGRALVILPGPPAVRRVFEICGLLELLPFAE
ncbi:STAS domain-containing protein [Paraconexibacter antarcticus]|uniref:Anti-sigma factor antagonist n=1 Tax=Paraconexibacter antarcticus TaxID=2949664 RepID=A0ABY5DUJ4_9ACTN|nr:STAS domain-containing protein [Paraconexibacter antarcticus]UTI65351.1 STAS domain-containing protein [Paraconexibacter antarcticus]